jgi:quercetin dioxygenase-like cupin family protein
MVAVQEVFMAHSLLVGSTLFLALACPVAALAAECPPEARGVYVRPPGPRETLGEETVTLLGAVTLGQGIDNRMLRLRRITLAPGAQVGWHAHGDRALLIYVESGTYTEYRSDCRVPIRHRAGDTIEETIGTKHWWRNEGTVPVVVLMSDITTPEAVDRLNLPPR